MPWPRAGQVDLGRRCRPAPRSGRASCARPPPRPGRGPPRPGPRRRSAGRRGARRWAARPARGGRARWSRRGRGPRGAQHQRGVGHVARERAALVERRREGDHPVAADRAVGGLEPDDPAQRRGLADRAAGVGADRPRRACRPPPPRRCRRSSRRARALRSHGFCTGPKPEFSFDEPIANSSWLVLPRTAAPASCEVAHAGGRVDGQVALEDARAGRAGHALDAEQVLDRHRRQRAGVGGRLVGHPQVRRPARRRRPARARTRRPRRRRPRRRRSAPPAARR